MNSKKSSVERTKVIQLSHEFSYNHDLEEKLKYHMINI